ncbi:netrin receptor DCC-like isoform X2 [Convolutriloba macropyga]|uniref:netrin receptor DCC-like isoform X2 n=1 Tax=Convolutriloba macropyga TaxID=536237 RepID=UPI003F525BD5
MVLVLLVLFSSLHADLVWTVSLKDFSFDVNPVKPYYSVTPGSSYTLSCPLDFSKYQPSTEEDLRTKLFWYFNGRQFSGDTDTHSVTAALLHITKVEDAVYGNYSCRFLALDGASVTSPPMRLVKGSAPSLIKQSRTLDVREKLLFYVECLGDFGSPTGTVTWFVDNEEIPGSSSTSKPSNGDSQKSTSGHRSLFTSLPSGLLEIGGISQSDFNLDSKIHCEVTNQHGKDTSGGLTLTFINPTGNSDYYKMENKRDVQIFIPIGERAVLECGPSLILSGKGTNPDPVASFGAYSGDSFTWNRKQETGSQLIDWAQQPSKYSIIGQFNLEVKKVTSQDSGQYQCIIQSEGRYIHIDVMLQVVESPEVELIDEPIEIKEVSEHETTTFSCPITSQPAPEIKWLHNSIPVTPGEFYKLNLEGTELTIYGSEGTDEGIFQCLATNDFGWASTFGHLHVIRKDQSGSQLLSNLGPPETVLAVTISSRFIQLAWQPPVLTSPFGVYGQTDSGTVGSNWVSPVSGGTTLTQNNPPSPPINIQGYEIRYWSASNSNRFKMITTRRGATSANITDLTPRTSYSFRVRALDKSGGVGAFSGPLVLPTLPEVLKPERVRNLRIDGVSSRQIDLVWDDLDERFGILEYEVLFREENVASGYSRTSVVTTNHFAAVGLQEFSRYNFMVRARNQFGFGLHCEPIREQTLSDSPSGEPTSLKVFADSISRLILQWKPPKLEDWNGQLTGYYVKYREKRQRETKLEKYQLSDQELLAYISALDTGELAKTLMSEFVLKDLNIDAEYEVSVAAINMNGTGPYSLWITGRTMEKELPENEIPGKCELSADVITDTSISVVWKPPSNSNSTKIRSYRVYCNKLFPQPWDFATEIDSRQFSMTFTDLEPDTTYICAVLAYNKSPKMSDANAVQINVKTRVKQPLELPLTTPTNLKTLPLTEDSISVRFDANHTRGQVFQIRCMPRILEANNIKENIVIVNTSNTYYYFSNLRPSTEYMFDVRAVRGDKSSDWGFQISGTTQEDVPGDAPQEFDVTSDIGNDLTAVLTWKPPLQPNGRITGYLISYSQRLDEKNWAMEPVDGPALEMRVPDLQPETIYYFKIQAKTAVGTGPWSYIKTMKTGFFFSRGNLVPNDNSGVHPGVSSEIGLKKEHVYIIIAAVIGASLIVVCLILAFVVCHVFSKTANKHRLNPMQYMPAAETNSTMQTLQTFSASNPPDLWVGVAAGQGQQGQTHSGGPTPHHMPLEVKQIEQDALRKSPPTDALVSSAQPNGITYYQPPPIASQPNGYQGITPYQPLLPDPQKMSPQGFTTTSIAMANNSNPPPCSLMQPTPVMTTAHFPQLGRSAFMSATGVGGASGQSPLPATISSGASYPKGYHEVPTIQSPTALNLQLMQQQSQPQRSISSQDSNPTMPPQLYSPNSNVSDTSGGGPSTRTSPIANFVSSPMADVLRLMNQQNRSPTNTAYHKVSPPMVMGLPLPGQISTMGDQMLPLRGHTSPSRGHISPPRGQVSPTGLPFLPPRGQTSPIRVQVSPPIGRISRHASMNRGVLPPPPPPGDYSTGGSGKRS